MANRLLIDSTSGSRLLAGPFAGFDGNFILLGVPTMAEQVDAVAISVEMTGTLQNSIDGDTVLASAAQGERYQPTQPENGTGANQANRLYTDNGITIVDGADDTIDVFDLASRDIGAGAGRSALGQPVALTGAIGVLIVNSADSAGDLLIGGQGSGAAWSSLFNGDDSAVVGPIEPGGFFALYSAGANGIAIADATNHLLKLAASGGDVSVNFHLIGRG